MSNWAKCTFFFEFSDYGWTESYWYNYGGSDLNLALPIAQNLAKKRMALNGLGVSMPAIRVSDDQVYRDSLYSSTSYITASDISQVPGNVAQGGALTLVKPILNAPPQDCYDSIEIRMEGGASYRRYMYLRGAPNSVFTNPPGPNFPPEYIAGFSTWASALEASWLFRVQNKDGNFAQLPIVQVIPGAGGADGSINMGVIPAWANGNLIRVGGFRGYAGIRGKYRISNAAGAVITLTGFKPPSIPPNVFGYGQLISTDASQGQPKYQNITNVIAETQTHRVTGRPSFGPRGRRRAKAS
jgi:hypothetical protein